MRRASSSRRDGVQDIKKKNYSPRSLGNMEEKRRGKMRVGSRESAKRSARCSALERTIKSSFIHTVSSNYQCIYSKPLGVAIVF